MNHRSLLDYLNENLATPREGGAGYDVERVLELEQRLAELEKQIAAPPAGDEDAGPQEAADSAFASRIESIVRRRTRDAGQQESCEPTRRHVEPAAPPLAPDMSFLSAEMLAEFRKFVEAVYLIGQAAKRFRDEPEARASLPERDAPPVDKDAIRLTLALKDAVSAFQSVAVDLGKVAADIRHAAAANAAGHPERRGVPRDDADIDRLRDELEDLRARLGAHDRRRPRSHY